MNDFTPVVWQIGRDDVSYMIDALMDAADARRKRGGRLHESIADRIDDLALRLHDASRLGPVQIQWDRGES